MNTAKLLIKKGADIEARERNGATALMMAFKSAQPQTARMLMEQGANVNVKDKEGTTVLMTVCMRGYTGFVRKLLEKGVNVNAKNKDGETALDYAQDEDVRKLLKEAGKKTEAPHLTQTLSGLEEKDNRESAYTLSGEYARGNDISVSVANRALRNGR